MAKRKPAESEKEQPAEQWVYDPAIAGVENGTAAMNLIFGLVGSLSEPFESWHPDVGDRSQAALQLLKELRPKGPAESMLAVQMIATHEAAMNCLQRAMIAKQPAVVQDLYLKHAVKLLGLYERQFAALDKHRGKGQQKVTVEYVHGGGRSRRSDRNRLDISKNLVFEAGA